MFSTSVYGELPASNYYGKAQCLSCLWSMTYGSSAKPPQPFFDAVLRHSEHCPGPVLCWSNTPEGARFFIAERIEDGNVGLP